MKTIDGREIRLFAFDLDDTFLNTDKSFDPENVRALEYLRDGGVDLVVASGRFLFSGTDIVRSIGLGLEENENIFDGGGTIGKNGERQAVLNFMEPDAYREFARAVHDLGIRPAVTDGEKIYYEEGSPIEPIYGPLMEKRPELFEKVASLEDLGPMLKFIVLTPDNETKAALRALAGPEIAVYSGGPNMIEVSNPKMNKWSGLEYLMKEKGITPDEVIAIGDSGNDAPMLRGAGLGIAMKNALGEAREATDHFTEYDNNHQGFAREIYRLFGEPKRD